MSRGYTGIVGPDGRSATSGLQDHAAGADQAVVTPEVQAKLDAIFEAGDLDTVRAQYKLEVVFNEERSVHRPFTGLVMAWTNGGYANGGGDEAVYFCTARTEKRGVIKTCGHPLDLKWIGKKIAVCPSCRSAVKPVDLAGQIGAKLPFQGWAKLIAQLWVLLGLNADIRVGTLRDNLHHRTDAVLQGESPSAGDKLNVARERRRWVIYRLKNILKDTSHGADLERTIKAFLSA